MAQLISKWRLCVMLFTLLCGQIGYMGSAQAQNMPAQETTAKSQAPAKKEAVREIAGTNQIPLLDNRFRIDYEVDAVTLVFFRKKGSPAIVLVRPDGSKVYARTAKENDMEWFDDSTYDLIKINKPTPGPWQAIGELLPESRIMVLTDIDLKVDPLPKDMMLGELLKVTARLTNGGKPVNAKDFRDILQLDVLLISTQKAGYDNANSTVIEFTRFLDDGKDFDERPRDAVFTGEFNLKMQAGEWIPKYIVKTPLYTRELLQDPILVVRTPIEISAVEGLGPDDKHQVIYKVTDGPMDAKSLLIQGRLRYPTGDVQSFTLSEHESDERVLEIANAGMGTYRIEQMLYGKTKSGREFVIVMPEYTFAAVGPKVEVPKGEDIVQPASADSPAGSGNATSDGAVNGSAIALEPATPPPEPEPEFPWGMVIFVNVLILIIGAVVVVLTMYPSAAAQSKMLFAKINPAGLLKKRAAEKSAQAAAAEPTASDDAMKKAPKNKASDDILDLSLPDD